MKRERASGPARRGFTLIELLVVIAIIGILMSLLLAAVMKVSGKAEEVQTRNDISQLDTAISSFKAKYGPYFPSRFYMGKQKSDFMAHGRLGNESFQYINTIWHHIPWLKADGITENVFNWPTGYMEGHQCLVFFLAGPPVGPGGAPAGFSPNPLNPFEPPSAGQERITFHDFPTNRLSTAAGFFSVGSKNSTFPCYLDPYKKSPYAYFSGYKTQNGYNRYLQDSKSDAGWDKISGSDCASLKVWPYAEVPLPVVKYLNPNSHQIISAGLNKIFGRGYVFNDNSTVWSAKNPLTKALYSIAGGSDQSTAGNDDVSNFHDRFLGIPAN